MWRRMKRGWQLTGKSWRLLKANRSLVRFPIYGGLTALVPVILLVLPGIYLIDTHDYAPGIPLLAVGLYLATIAVFYFSVGLAAAADAIFHGREATVGDGLAVARSRFGSICGWALVSTVVGVVIAVLESRGVGGQIAGRLFGAAWSLVTFLAVPVIAIEGVGPWQTLKRSGSLFRSRWPGQITGNIAIGAAVALFGILPAIAIIVVGVVIWANAGAGTDVAAGAVLVAVGVAVVIVAALIQRALQGIFGVALYRFALDGEAVGGFTADELDSAVASRA